MTIKVCHLSSVHPPFDKRIFHRECKTLALAGYDVSFVVPHTQDEIVDGVKIRGVSKGNRYVNRFLRIIWQVYRVALQEDAKIYHFHDPELIIVGLLLKSKGKKVIYDTHEDTPRQILTKSWIPKQLRGILSGIAEAAEAIGNKMFDNIVAATPPIGRRFHLEKTAVVQNFPNVSEFAAHEEAPYAGRPAKVIYLGLISKTRGSVEMVQAISQVPVHLQARLVLVGDIVMDAERCTLEALPGWEHTDFIAWQPRGQLKGLLAQARVALCLLHPGPTYTESYPVKLFEYMAAGLPLVASNFPIWENIIKEADCGLVVDPLDLSQIAAANQWLLEHPDEAEQMGKRGQQAVQSHYNWDMEARKLLALYDRIAQS